MRNPMMLFLLVLSISMSGQGLEIGQKWYVQEFDYDFWRLKDTTYIKIDEIIGDTLIDGEKFFVLQGGCRCDIEYGIKHFRQEGQKYYAFYGGEKHLLYDFTLEKGDTFKIKVPYPMNCEIDTTAKLVDTTYNQFLGGAMRKVIEFDPDFDIERYCYMDWGNTFIEGVGAYGFCYLPQFGLCEFGSGPIRCFETASGEIIKFTKDEECGRLPTSVDRHNTQFRIYPNPATDQILVEGATKGELRMYTLEGKEVLHYYLNKESSTIDISYLPAGLYMVSLERYDFMVNQMIVVR